MLCVSWSVWGQEENSACNVSSLCIICILFYWRGRRHNFQSVGTNIAAIEASRKILRVVWMSLLYSVVRVRCRHKESLRSLSHLLMSFFFIILYVFKCISRMTL